MVRLLDNWLLLDARKDPRAPGDLALNWAGNDVMIGNGTDSGNKRINGTPRAKNSASP